MNVTLTNEDVLQDILRTVPEKFYGEVTLQFHKGLITHSKTTQQKKYNTTSKATSPEANNANSTRK